MSPNIAQIISDNNDRLIYIIIIILL